MKVIIIGILISLKHLDSPF
jgi:hypothetical protein